MGLLDILLGKPRPAQPPKPNDASTSSPTGEAPRFPRPQASKLDEHQLWTSALQSLEAGRTREAVKLGQEARRVEAHRRGYEWDPAFANPEYSVDEAATILTGGRIRDHLQDVSTDEEQVLRWLFAAAIFKGIGVEEAGRLVRGLFWSGHWTWADLEAWCLKFTKLGRWPHMWDARLQVKPERTERVADFSARLRSLSPEARAVLGVRSRPWQEIQSEEAARELFHWPEPAWTAARSEIETLYELREPSLDDVLAATMPELKGYCRSGGLPVGGAKAVLQDRLRGIGADRLRELLPETFAPARRLPWGKGDADIDSWVDYHNQVATLFAHRVLVSSPERKKRELERYRTGGVVKGVKILAVEDPICEQLDGRKFLFSRQIP